MRQIYESLRECLGVDYDSAWTMPPEFYTSEKFLEIERRELFQKEWVCLGRSHQVCNPGDFFTAEVNDEPLLIVKTRENEIKILSNVCRHRGSIIVEGDGNAKGFVCPYHSWSYDIDGSLKRTPFIENRSDFEKDSCRLPSFACEIWGGFIYVNLNGKAEPLNLQLQGLSDLIKNYHVDDMVELHGEESVWETNWKCLAENFMEGYHLSSVHEKTLHSITPTKLCSHYPPGRSYFGYFATFPENINERGRYHPDLNKEERQRSVMFSVPPSHVASVTGHIVTYLYLQPHTSGSVKVKRGISFSDPNISEHERSSAIDLFERTMKEDKAQLEKLQKGLKSSKLQISPLAPANYEGNVLDFYQYMARRLVFATRENQLIY